MAKELKKWMPMFWPEYLADTGHLNAAEHGAYLMLIAHYWMKGSVPWENEELVRRISKMTPRQWAHSRDVLRSFFGDDGRNKRCDIELAYALEKSRINSANAKLSHSERRRPADTPTPTPTPTKKVSKNLNGVVGGNGEEKRKPRNKQKSKNGMIWLDKGTEDFNTYAADYFEKRHVPVTLQWHSSGTWFKIRGEQ